MRLWFVLVWSLIFVSTINGSAQRTAADFVKQAQTKEQHKDYDGAIASNYHAAIADYDRAIQINPQDAEAYKGRGATRELQKDWARALTDYYRSGEVAQTQETKDLVHLLIWVVRTRLGQPAVANQELSFYLGKRSRSWSAKAGTFLLGKIRESEFLSATNSYDPHKIQVLQCQTWYYIGIKQFLAKETNVAKECFAKCLAMGPLAADEWVYAQGELRILNASG
jgi:tetratricopeptide (TPR) repeat protein